VPLCLGAVGEIDGADGKLSKLVDFKLGENGSLKLIEGQVKPKAQQTPKQSLSSSKHGRERQGRLLRGFLIFEES
jgi:hypothetical protein